MNLNARVTGFMLIVFSLLAGGLFAASAGAAYNPEDPAQKAEYDDAFEIATEGYEFGMPVLNMARTFRKSTSVNVPSGRGAGPVNQFSHFTELADVRDRTVVLPNNDTLYSMAWLDLSRGPVVIHTKKPTKRFHVLELLDPWQKNFANIGSPPRGYPDGSYLIAPKGWKGKKPKGLTTIRAPYDRVWIIGRTIVYNEADLANIPRVQKTYAIVPLRRWNPKRPYSYRRPQPAKVDRTTNEAYVPGTRPGQNPAVFFDALGNQLKRFPARKIDAPVLRRLRALGIGPGRKPLADGELSDAQIQAMADAVTQGPDRMRADLLTRYLNAFDAKNGWNVARMGVYGTDYETRALVDQFGLGAPRPAVAVYPLALFDSTRMPLTGAKSYVAHFTPNYARPPVKFFWSMTLYDNDSFLVDNPYDRYVINDRSRPRYNPDGSLDLYIQPTEPSDPVKARNWLPSPPADAETRGFRILMRLYGLSSKAVKGVLSGKGWQGPTILPCDEENQTSTGISCAG